MNWKKKLAIGAGVITTTTVALHLINKYILTSAKQNKSLEYIPDLYYEWKFGEISYKKQGKGDPILLVHDLTTYSSGYEWNKVASLLAETNTVYSIDLLGCGNSDKPNLTYTNFLYVQLINDFIKNVIGDNTTVIVTGESSSFIIAAAVNNKDIIKDIIMVNPMDINILNKAPNNISKYIAKFINTPVFGTFFYNMMTKKKKTEDLFHTDYFFDFSSIDEEMVKIYYETAHADGSKHLFASLSGFYTTLDVSHCLKKLDNNITIIIGDDISEYDDIAEDYREILPSIKIKKIEETKYLPHLEKPEKFVEKIKNHC